MKNLIILIFACFAVATQAQTISQLKKDMYGIASDATEGRFTASPGYLKAAHYVATQLKAAGIKPGWKEKSKRTYLQPVPFSWDNYSGSVITIKGKNFWHDGPNFIVTQ